jgi:hypothetical protein
MSKIEMPERLEPWCQLVQKVLSDEFKEPLVNFRKISEKIVMKIFLRAGVIFPFSDITFYLKRLEFFDKEQRDLIISSLETTALETGVFLDDIEEAKQIISELYNFIQELQSVSTQNSEVKT